MLGARGASVLLSYLRLDEPPDEGTPGGYRVHRAASADDVVAGISDAGGRAAAIEADLADPSSPAALFDAAERHFGPVDILINNASAWLADTFKPATADRLGRTLQPVSAATFDRQFAVDARAGALLIAEFARRHVERGASWGRIVGLTSGGPFGFPEEVSYGAAKAALENYTMSAASELAGLGVTANIVYPPVTDTGWITEEVRRSVEASDELVGVAQPEEVAEVIAWIVSDEARLVTGNIIRLR
ncbi:MAG: SDR family oxidoreductase [Actinomycetota bacterium]|nr:SDR family oxidoreductase [Actinomycetota bacterium]